MKQLIKLISEVNDIIEDYFGYELDKYIAYNNIYKTHDYEGGPCPSSYIEQKRIVSDFKKIDNKDNRDLYSINKCVKDRIYGIYLCSKMRDEKNVFFFKHLTKINKYISILEKNLENIKKKDITLFNPPLLKTWYLSLIDELYEMKIRKYELELQEKKHDYPYQLVEELLNNVCNLNKTENYKFKEHLRKDARKYFDQKNKDFQKEFKKISNLNLRSKQENIIKINSLKYNVNIFNRLGLKSKKQTHTRPRTHFHTLQLPLEKTAYKQSPYSNKSKKKSA